MDKTVLEEGRELCGWLAVLDGPYKGEAYRLYSGKTIVGSSPDCDIILPGLEPKHFSLRCKAGDFFVTDLDTEAGTFVGEERACRTKIKDQERIKAGDHLLAIKII